MISIRDDRGRELTFTRVPERVVSLVPSDTFTIGELAGYERLVGRTDYCCEPAGVVEAIATVGGTKSAKVDAIAALRPDVVIANQEENHRATLEALAQRGVPVFVVFPKRVADGVALIARYAKLLGVEGRPGVRDRIKASYAGLRALEAWRATVTPRRTFCPIWLDPLMTIHGSTFISDALDLCGAQNVFADRERRYPLAADLGERAPIPKDQLIHRDTRYPRMPIEEVVARDPELTLLPDEPHAF
ncbi:MAG: helical backbone metal receptor, partial [Polyangiales bacterium]